MTEREPPAAARYELLLGSLIAAFVLTAWWSFGTMNSLWSRPSNFWTTTYYVKTSIEVVASAYAVFYLLVAWYYRMPVHSRGGARWPRQQPSIYGAYLCCDDLDVQALESMVAFCGRDTLRLLVHDDSSTPSARAQVDEVVQRFRQAYRRDIQVLRRVDRSGGKPGALNNIIEQLPAEVEYLLLCDSDSFLLDENLLAKALPYFDEPDVALIQFRTIGHQLPGDGPGYRILASSVAFYDAFVSFMDRFGWSPFLGHNALLRVSAVTAVGGFTPGQLADDIDFSVKLRLHGYHLRYARNIVCGERHPLSYGALRRRTRKWAYGCTQILLRWGWPVLTSPRFSLAEKGTFFLTVSYYHFQLLLLLYLAIFYLLLPFDDRAMGGMSHVMVSAWLILLLTFFPSISYFAQAGRLRHWPKTVIYWGFTYGSQDFVMLEAVWRCLWRKQLAWVPTNTGLAVRGTVHFFPELCFGSLVVVVALLQHPALLLLPTTILFVGKFLVAPFLERGVFRAR